VGTQFHPEADPVSFVSHLRNKEAKKNKAWKEKKIQNMLEDLMDDDKIYRTNETLIFSYSHKWSDANKMMSINHASSPWFQTIENSSMPNLQKKNIRN
jgi:uncharacterized phage-associated protein